jgi:hypothetical protein
VGADCKAGDTFEKEGKMNIKFLNRKNIAPIGFSLSIKHDDAEDKISEDGKFVITNWKYPKRFYYEIPKRIILERYKNEEINVCSNFIMCLMRFANKLLRR